MAEKRMACWNCPRYDRTERVCLDGKANPKKKADAVELTEVLGLRALCHYSPYRDSLAIQMHFPTTALGVASVAARPKRRGRNGAIEIEIEDSEIEMEDSEIEIAETETM
jgi:hypothetical protein